MKDKSTSLQLTKAAIELLTLKGYKVWRQNNTGKMPGGRFASVTKGIPDVIGFHRTTSQFIAIEIKIGRDKLRPEQDKFLQEVKESGGVAFVIKTMDDLEMINKTLI